MKTIIYAIAIVLLPTSLLAQTENWDVYFSPETISCPVEIYFKRSGTPAERITLNSSPVSPQTITLPSWISGVAQMDKVSAKIGSIQQLHVHEFAISSVVIFKINQCCDCIAYEFEITVNYTLKMITITTAPPNGWACDGPECNGGQE
ncbi:MAG: hypothetical protein CL840_20090 [Crocinitomicaceae bacterium]|nr:hypothetical protein [Crocinitomicaceae bacterium]|tara:strand:- start:10355 stop:10798 length:444 start_codon:yes stop_codon:yes gene_type:complete